MVMAFSTEIVLTWFEVSLATIFFSPALVGVQITSDLMILPGCTSLRRKESGPSMSYLHITGLISQFLMVCLKEKATVYA